MKKMVLTMIPLLALTACVTNEVDDRICIDYGSFTTVEEKCIPLYGAIICSERKVTKMYCKLYAEDTPRKEEE